MPGSLSQVRSGFRMCQEEQEDQENDRDHQKPPLAQEGETSTL